MKKLFTAAIVALSMMFGANNAQAQVQFGIKGGLNVTSMSLDKDKLLDTENQAGFFIGPTVKFTLPIVGLGIDASALYDQREAKIKGDGDDKDITSARLKTQAINIPINLRYGVGLGSVANVFFFAGPQFGFNVGDKNKSIFQDAAEWKLKSSNFSVNVVLASPSSATSRCQPTITSLAARPATLPFLTQLAQLSRRCSAIAERLMHGR